MVVFTILVIVWLGTASGECIFSAFNITLQNTCDWSAWLPWNCTCCGNDVIHRKFAIRKRTICCSQNLLIGECLTKCGYEQTDDTSFGKCRNSCPTALGNNSCGLNMTSSIMTTTVRADSITEYSGITTGTNLALIASTVCGSLLGVLLTALLLFGLIRWKKRKRSKRVKPKNSAQMNLDF